MIMLKSFAVKARNMFMDFLNARKFNVGVVIFTIILYSFILATTIYFIPAYIRSLIIGIIAPIIFFSGIAIEIYLMAMFLSGVYRKYVRKVTA